MHQDDSHAHGGHDRPGHHEPASGHASRPAHAPITFATVAPISAGLFTTVTPASWSAFIFFAPVPPRSEERRVGEEGRSRGAPDHLKKKRRYWLEDWVQIDAAITSVYSTCKKSLEYRRHCHDN